MTDAIKSTAMRLLPPAAGRFGERSMADRLGDVAQRPVGCPSVEQFEARMTAVNPPRRIDRLA